MKIAIVIPTFNEAKNILPLIEELLSLGLDMDISVVDDNSADRTAMIVKEHFKNTTNVSVLVRVDKRGRGSACMDGFKHFLSNGKIYDYVFEMDSDFSHNPKEIYAFLEKIKEYDMVIGSRYHHASRIVNWSLRRRIFSKIANFYARFLLGIPITDYTNGYRCYRYNVLKDLDISLIKKSGYIVLSEMAYLLFLKGYSIGEIPTLFINRKIGASNMNIQEILDAFTGIACIRFSLPGRLKRSAHRC